MSDGARMGKGERARVAAVLAPGLPVLLAGLLYLPVTRAYFYSDDVLTLVRIVDTPAREMLLRPFAGHLLIARNAIFMATYGLFGLDPAPFYWSLYLGHLLNVWLLFRVLRTLVRSDALACLGATMWGASPVHVATVGWYAVFGQVLAATLLLVVLDRLVRTAASRQIPGWPSVASCCALLLIGATCFGVGIGVALAFPVVAVLLVPGVARQRVALGLLLALPLAVVALDETATRWAGDVVEVALRTRVLSRWAPIAVMFGHLVAYGATALCLGFWYGPYVAPYNASRYPDVTSYVAVAVLLGALLLAAGQRRSPLGRPLLAAAILVVAAYGIVALGRANLVPGDMAAYASSGRYHYVGTIGLCLLLVLTLRRLGSLGTLRVLRPDAMLAVFLVSQAVGYARGTWQVDTHGQAREYVQATRATIEAAVDSHPPGATVYIDNGTAPAAIRGWFIDSRGIPGRAAIFILLYPDDLVRGRRVRFVERDAGVIAWFATRPSARLRGLLVPAAGAVQG